MLVALGFLLATLIALLLAPAYRARAMRLTYKQIRRTLPLTDDELIVERDRLRAHYAVRIHDLETSWKKPVFRPPDSRSRLIGAMQP